MPPLGFWPHVPLLAQFQRIVELHESRRLLLDLVRANQRADHDYKELKVPSQTHSLLKLALSICPLNLVVDSDA